jgi:hypothetical protein
MEEERDRRKEKRKEEEKKNEKKDNGWKKLKEILEGETEKGQN